ncbi:MAG: DUF2244 domain-containing protein [Burkholderiales bacterium]
MSERRGCDKVARRFFTLARAPIPANFSIVLKRNCSISPEGLARVFALLAAASIAIGIGFAAFGAWLVLPFAGAEALALGVAFFVYARHAADYERIELESERLTVEVADAERTARYVLDSRAARVCLDSERGSARVLLRSPGRELEVGRHLDAEARVELASELEKRLRT